MMVDAPMRARVLALCHWQLVAALLTLWLGAWAADQFLRRRWTPPRRSLMSAQLLAARHSLLLAAALWGATHLLVRRGAAPWLVLGAGFVAVVAALMTGLRVARVFVYQWLFAHSQREGVPALLVDLFSIVASVVLFGALLHEVFLIEVASLLATSAVMSVVLGLALQDTLGQLFAGISLQLDRPFRLGDWVEVHLPGERVSGQVLEVSWRATLLLAIGEELITVPNKSIAQGVVLNFSGRDRAFVRGHVFRVPLDCDVRLAKRLLLEAAAQTEGVVADPAPVPLIIDTTESWVTLKMINFVRDFGQQYAIGDRYHERVLALFAEHGIALAAPRLRVLPATPRGDAPTETLRPGGPRR